MLVCPVCKEEIKASQRCYQVRIGYLEEGGEIFQPEEDVAYYHEDCLPEGI